MRTPYAPSTPRRVLCVYPEYARSFGTFQHAYQFFGRRVRAFMPPQGLLAVAAYLPASWEVRFVDENSERASAQDLRWAEVVFVSGMHVQQPQIHDLIGRAHAAGRPVVLGGPSVSGCPEFYPDADIVHLGELGDATDRLIEYLDRHTGRPRSQLRFETATRLPLSDFPTPTSSTWASSATPPTGSSSTSTATPAGRAASSGSRPPPGCPCPTSRRRPTSGSAWTSTSSRASSSRAAARTRASSATFRRCTGAIRA
jgi:hypothetical protein